MKILMIAGCLFLTSLVQAQTKNAKSDGQKERAFFVQTLLQIANPVLNALGKNELHKLMPIEAKAGITDRPKYSHLEAFARTLTGMAPWLELGYDKSEEGLLRKKYIQLARKCIDNATNPKSADFMNFNKGGQPLVDAAFFAQALLRAPNQLWLPLEDSVKKNVVAALKSTRGIVPANNNWLLFSAIIEAALLRFDGSCDTSRIEHALRQHFIWYKGDGVYGDGADFHFDYYNSFVIQPMLIEVLQVMGNDKKKMYDTVLQRAIRYASIQERMISPEATYPLFGRSITYRFGAFQLLSKIAAMHLLDSTIQPAQVRSALYHLIKKQVEAKGTFDKEGWLTIGCYGHQPGLGENYISTGSLYLCTQAFLVLGLPATDTFWTGKDLDWTSKQIVNGKDLPNDHAIK